MQRYPIRPGYRGFRYRGRTHMGAYSTMAARRYKTAMPQQRVPYRRNYVPAQIAGPIRELKSVDFADANVRNCVAVAAVAGAANLATGMTQVSGSAQGDASYEHTGKQISMQSFQLELELAQPQTDASGSTVRVILLYDRQPNGAYPAIGDVLADNAGAPTFNSGINIGYRQRYAVLRDAQITLNYSGPLTAHYETFIRRPLAMNFIGITNAIASLGSGAVYLIVFFNQLVGTTAPTITSVHCRTRFYDA